MPKKVPVFPCESSAVIANVAIAAMQSAIPPPILNTKSVLHPVDRAHPTDVREPMAIPASMTRFRPNQSAKKPMKNWRTTIVIT
jgi:hypothetical protein